MKHHDKERGETAAGCILIILASCAGIGGLLFFFKVLIDLFTSLT